MRWCSLAGGYDDEAAADLQEAADAYGELGLRFDRARTLLSLGSAQRRVRKWGAARTLAPVSRYGVRRDGIAGMGRRRRGRSWRDSAAAADRILAS